MSTITPCFPPEPAFPSDGFRVALLSGEPGNASASEVVITQAAAGMTLRDYFASAALAPMLARSVFGPAGTISRTRYEGRDISVEELYAVVAYRMADAMIAERLTSADKRGQYSQQKDMPTPGTPGAS